MAVSKNAAAGLHPTKDSALSRALSAELTLTYTCSFMRLNSVQTGLGPFLCFISGE